MLYKDICKILGYYFFLLTCAMTVPFCMAFYYEYFVPPALHPQPHSTEAFAWTLLISLALSGLCYLVGKNSSGQLYRREGFLSVVIIWFVTPAISALPLYFNGTIEDPSKAYFEATSGFTTTGATVLEAKHYAPDSEKEIPIQHSFCGSHTTTYTYWGTIKPVRDVVTGKIQYEGIEAVGKAILFWRSMMNWLGGMGILVLFIAILPALGIGAKVLFQAETTGPIKESLTPRVKETASHLWKIYVGITVIEIVLLLVTNREMSLFDSVTVSFSTLSTGGFAVKNASIGAFNNAWTDWIVTIFMLIGGANFSLYFFLLQGKLYKLYEPELFLFLAIAIGSCCFAAWYLVGTENILMTGENGGIFSWTEAFRYASFQIVSSLCTTGFATADYDNWPYAVQALMLILMFTGGMSGSTAGGMKIIRQYLFFKIAQYKVESLFRPESVRIFKLGNREVDQSVAVLVLSFILILISISVASTFIFIVDGIDPETSIALTANLINNVGMGFRMSGPTLSCAFLSDFGLLYGSFIMLFGRLEFLTVLAVLVPAFWRQSR